jgi:hypothetical protein
VPSIWCLRQAGCDGQHKKPDEARRIAVNIAKLPKNCAFAITERRAKLGAAISFARSA